MANSMTNNPYLDWPGDRLLKVKTRVMAAQARSCWGCLHVGEWAFFIWVTNKRDYGWRLELFTPLHRFRWHRGSWR